MLEKRIRLIGLYDLYGSLLTAHQREVMEMHYLQDLSLGEIAEQSGTTRQAAHDVLRRVENILENYEINLRLAEREDRVRGLAQEALEALEGLGTSACDEVRQPLLAMLQDPYLTEGR